MKSVDLTAKASDGKRSAVAAAAAQSGAGRAPVVPGAAVPGPGRADAGLAFLLLLAASTLYAAFALRLAEGRLYEYYNLAFDFDASRVLSMLTGSPPDGMGFKHPLLIAARPLGLAAMALGLAPKAAAGLVMAAVGGGAVALVFLFLRAARIARPEALALTLLYAVSGTQTVAAVVTETYGFALLTLALAWLLARLSMDGAGPERRLRAARVAVTVAVAGVTVTNALQPFVAEAALLWRRFGLAGAVRRLVAFGVAVGLLFVVCALLLWGRTIWEALQDPLNTARQIWWDRTFGEKTGPGEVLRAFLAYSFVSPEFTVVPLPEGTRMLDFRDWTFSPAGGVAVWLWVAFLAAGTAGALLHPGYRAAVALPVLAALLANLVLHLDFQYRGSLYIYAAHTHILVFALTAGLAPWLGPARPRTLRAGYVAAVLALAVLVGAVNLRMAADFSTRFDVPDTPCPAPCT